MYSYSTAVLWEFDFPQMQSVFRISQEAVVLGVPEELVGCPFALTPHGALNTLNRYLQKRWLGRWSPPAQSAWRRHRLMPSSMMQTAHRLMNFHQWCAEKTMHLGFELDPTKVGEEDLETYARHMQNGQWSADGSSISASTVGQRQIAAIHYREWLADTGLAPPIELQIAVSKKRIATASGATTVIEQKRYAVVRRADPNDISCPPTENVVALINNLTDIADQLAAKLAAFCGLRASEIANLKLADATSVPPVGRQNFISVLGKGNKRRRVEIDEDLYSEIAEYVQYSRAARCRRLQRPALEQRLLLRANGQPMLYQHVWRVFYNNCDFSPHLARHWYAVHYLLAAWKREREAAARSGLQLAAEGMSTYLSVDLIRLQVNLGHASFDTTLKYLVTLSQFIGDGTASSYQRLLDADD